MITIAPDYEFDPAALTIYIKDPDKSKVPQDIWTKVKFITPKHSQVVVRFHPDISPRWLTWPPQ